MDLRKKSRKKSLRKSLKKIQEKSPRKNPKAIPAWMPKGFTEEIPKGIPGAINEGIPEGISDGMPENIPKGISKGINERIPGESLEKKILRNIWKNPVEIPQGLKSPNEKQERLMEDSRKKLEWNSERYSWKKNVRNYWMNPGWNLWWIL